MSLTPVTNGKNLQSKFCLDFFWTPLGSRVSIYIFFTSSFKVVSSLIIAPIVCHRCKRHRWQFATGIVDTSGKFALPPVSTTLAKRVEKFAAGVVDTNDNFAGGVVDTGGAP